MGKIIILLFIISTQAFCQDELYFRELFSGDLTRKKDKIKKDYKWRANTPFYQIDLGSNKWPESIVVEKKDGEDWLYIHNDQKKRIFSFQFDVNGKESQVYKITKQKLSLKSDILIIYYYEGNTSYLKFNGTVRLYFLTIDNRKLDSISIHKGPVIWEERKNLDQKYFQKGHLVELIDFNKDLIKEIRIRGKITKNIYFYKGRGKWISI
ncbi:MAG: hypothetical protein DRQ88_08405 [Epsilonproteobacteria bacterium]|nr:MAG: hypothetical protein DRQ89_10880 [Campylobacterota bacterium]RLA65950.1 MAG: hypothetical protein DRQ88_08405 [Campylobacterota bacterium]